MLYYNYLFTHLKQNFIDIVNENLWIEAISFDSYLTPRVVSCMPAIFSSDLIS